MPDCAMSQLRHFIGIYESWKCLYNYAWHAPTGSYQLFLFFPVPVSNICNWQSNCFGKQLTGLLGDATRYKNVPSQKSLWKIPCSKYIGKFFWYVVKLIEILFRFELMNTLLKPVLVMMASIKLQFEVKCCRFWLFCSLDRSVHVAKSSFTTVTIIWPDNTLRSSVAGFTMINVPSGDSLSWEEIIQILVRKWRYCPLK